MHVIDKMRSPHSLDVADLDGDGQLEVVVVGNLDEFVGLLGIRGYRLLDQNMFAGEQCFPCNVVVGFGWSSNNNTLDIVATQHIG